MEGLEVNKNCRSCGTFLHKSFVDLGMSPLANSYIKKEQLGQKEKFFPLRAFVCEKCLLVQLEDFETPDNIFSDYAYFSSYSESWLAHAKAYSEKMIEKLNLGQNNFVVEIASNDGYLLKNFVAKGIPVLGVEPAKNVAEVAIGAGVRTHCGFFGENTAKVLKEKYGAADLIAANNVFAHVPELNDFILGFKTLLGAEGMITFEFPHLLELIRQVQFDTIYHEHFSYFSFLSAQKALERNGLRIADVEELPTHGGSLRLFVCHKDSKFQNSERISQMIKRERDAGLHDLSGYENFERAVQEVRDNLLRFLTKAKQDGKVVVAYGAPAKGNTLLNYCKIGSDLIKYTVDKSPHKQGTFLPGSHIPVYDPKMILDTRPDYVLILPWNLKREIAAQMTSLREWGGKFVTSHPSLEIF